jgi:hypothetical protein
VGWHGNGRALRQSAHIQMKLSHSSEAQGSAPMPDWKPEIRELPAGLRLAPTREAAIVEEIAQHLDDCYAESLSGGARVI